MLLSEPLSHPYPYPPNSLQNYQVQSNQPWSDPNNSYTSAHLPQKLGQIGSPLHQNNNNLVDSTIPLQVPGNPQISHGGSNGGGAGQTQQHQQPIYYQQENNVRIEDVKLEASELNR